jgi:hypothetical protein
MTELSNIENDIKTLEEKIDNWFHRHFISTAPGTETHSAILKAREEIKAIVGINSAADAIIATPKTPAA